MGVWDITFKQLLRLRPADLLGRADPGPTTERFDARLPCTPELSCVRFMLAATWLHRTQARDMEQVRSLRAAFAVLDLRQVDPWREIKAPDEPARD